MRTWIVTGASRGIGQSIARVALRHGDRVALVARGAVEDPPGAAEGSWIGLREDVTEAGAPERIVRATLDAFDSVDVLVNNAGLHRGGRIERLPEGDFGEVVATNLVAPFHMARAAVSHMARGATIVNVGAVVGLRGFSGDSAYGSAKAGLAGLTQVLAIELAGRGITVNCVIPGLTETEMTAGVDRRAWEGLLARIPIQRPCTTDEVAEVVYWVSASPAMTGALVPVDGGLMAALGSAR